MSIGGTTSSGSSGSSSSSPPVGGVGVQGRSTLTFSVALTLSSPQTAVTVFVSIAPASARRAL